MAIEGSKFCVRLGLPGAGKTLGMVEEDLLPHLIAGEQVYVNFFINWRGDNIHYFSDIEDVLHCKNCVIGFDEVGQVLDARSWDQETNQIRRFFQLHRHNHLDIYGTTQDISLVAKSALIVVDEWILCENFRDNAFVKWVFNLFHYDRVRMKYENMSLLELKKLARGVSIAEKKELAGDSEDIGSSEFDSFDDFDFDFIEADLNARVVIYTIKQLLHRELNDKKAELYYKFCPLCASRQGNKIPFDKNMEDEDLLEYCPKHLNQVLEYKESGIYDTDEIIDVPARPIVWKPYVPSPAGHRLIEFKGSLSSKQLPPSSV